jgi:hypothetical protein
MLLYLSTSKVGTGYIQRGTFAAEIRCKADTMENQCSVAPLQCFTKQSTIAVSRTSFDYFPRNYLQIHVSLTSIGTDGLMPYLLNKSSRFHDFSMR